ncbi:P-loop containing nucleoside triphosphate hydrolase protein, partial [Auriscalpium vulgare]
GELGLDIYTISLSKSGLDDTTLNSLISSLPPQCIAIMEDIDAAFTRGITRDNEQQERAQKHRAGGDVGRTRLTLSGLLNALDGVSAHEGRLLFATTNRYSVLDAALTRPGRMDLHVEFRLASRYQAREMFKRFFVPDPASAIAEGSTEQERFAASIPEREFSMASMQGYLMAYKVRPVQAAEDIEQWVKEQREDRERKATFEQPEPVKDSAAAGS